MPRIAAMASGLRLSHSGTVLAIVCLWAATATAQPKAAGGEGDQRRGPPPEAMAACKSLASGKECTFTLNSNTLKGSCWAPEGKPLACRTAGAPANGGGK